MTLALDTVDDNEILSVEALILLLNNDRLGRDLGVVSTGVNGPSAESVEEEMDDEALCLFAFASAFFLELSFSSPPP